MSGNNYGAGWTGTIERIGGEYFFGRADVYATREKTWRRIKLAQTKFTDTKGKLLEDEPGKPCYIGFGMHLRCWDLMRNMCGSLLHQPQLLFDICRSFPQRRNLLYGHGYGGLYEQPCVDPIPYLSREDSPWVPVESSERICKMIDSAPQDPNDLTKIFDVFKTNFKIPLSATEERASAATQSGQQNGPQGVPQGAQQGTRPRFIQLETMIQDFQQNYVPVSLNANQPNTKQEPLHGDEQDVELDLEQGDQPNWEQISEQARQQDRDLRQNIDLFSQEICRKWTKHLSRQFDEKSLEKFLTRFTTGDLIFFAERLAFQFSRRELRLYSLKFTRQALQLFVDQYETILRTRGYAEPGVATLHNRLIAYQDHLRGVQRVFEDKYYQRLPQQLKEWEYKRPTRLLSQKEIRDTVRQLLQHYFQGALLPAPKLLELSARRHCGIHHVALLERHCTRTDRPRGHRPEERASRDNVSPAKRSLGSSSRGKASLGNTSFDGDVADDASPGKRPRPNASFDDNSVDHDSLANLSLGNHSQGDASFDHDALANGSLADQAPTSPSTQCHNDIFTRFPPEILGMILIQLSTEDMVHVKLASRAFNNLPVPDSFWMARFELSQELGYVFEAHRYRHERTLRGRWKCIYDVVRREIEEPLLFDTDTPQMANRRRIWDNAMWLKKLMKHKRDSVLQGQPVRSFWEPSAPKASRLAWTLAERWIVRECQDFTEGARALFLRGCTVPARMTAVHVSTTDILGEEYVCGLRFEVQGKWPDSVIGYRNSQSETRILSEPEGCFVFAFHLAMGKRGIRGLAVEDTASGLVSDWAGTHDGVPKHKLIFPDYHKRGHVPVHFLGGFDVSSIMPFCMKFPLFTRYLQPVPRYSLLTI